MCALREKCPNTEFYMVRISLYLFSPNRAKYGPEKTWIVFGHSSHSGGIKP